jgi:2-polyprenyl-3-methyl-5-hydroxy-6-metoxy-1,4-benzoquinol methylase
VLDFGCGSGYGVNLLADHCEDIVGVDISSEAIGFATNNYSKKNANFLQIDPIDNRYSLPFCDESFEVVLSYQVIEHLKEPDSYLREIERVLQPRGKVLLATPDRVGRLFSHQKPWNVWHEREYSSESLRELLDKYFNSIEIYYMGGDNQFVSKEFNRTNLLKWITLPVTLPFIPEPVRKRSLHLLKKIKNTLNPSTVQQKYDFQYDDNLVSISDRDDNSVNLIASANKG